jgi:hypothetical protein
LVVVVVRVVVVEVEACWAVGGNTEPDTTLWKDLGAAAGFVEG